MSNFQVKIVGAEYRIYFSQDFIGRVVHDPYEGGYLVTPANSRYTGFFKSLEVAITELVFHTYGKHSAIPTC